MFVVGKCKTEEENSRIEAEMAEHADVVRRTQLCVHIITQLVR